MLHSTPARTFDRDQTLTARVMAGQSEGGVVAMAASKIASDDRKQSYIFQTRAAVLQGGIGQPNGPAQSGETSLYRDGIYPVGHFSGDT